jgi:hypothetical protein
VSPSKPGPGTERRSFALYSFRFACPADLPVPKEQVVNALVAEGVPAVPGYARPVYDHPLFRDRDLGIRYYPQLKDAPPTEPCPVSERLARTEAIWLSQQSLLCDSQGVHQIAAGIRKVAEGVPDLARAS